MLIYGIPNFKLEKNIVERRTKLLQEGGIKFELVIPIMAQKKVKKTIKKPAKKLASAKKVAKKTKISSKSKPIKNTLFTRR